jgi:hypothetical protein
MAMCLFGYCAFKSFAQWAADKSSSWVVWKTWWLLCVFFQYTYIVVKYKIHLYSLRNRPEKLAKGSLFCLFLKLVQINFIFSDNVCILYIYLHLCPRNLNYHTGSRFIKLHLVAVFIVELPVAMSKRKVSDKTFQKLEFFSRVSCRFIVVFLRLS